MSVNYRACFTYYNGSGPLRQNNLFPLADFKPKAAIGFANNENKGRFYRKVKFCRNNKSVTFRTL